MSAEEHLAELFSAADGDIVGRIRLQKIAYLLQQKAGGSHLFFTYHHYGPHCSEFAEALDRCIMMKEIEETLHDTGYGTTYSAFRRKKRQRRPAEAVGSLEMAEAKPLVANLKKIPSVVLELAATIHWLKHKERVADWKATLKARKTVKATDQNIARAERVLAELGLAA